MKNKITTAVIVGLIIGSLGGYFLKPREESEVEKDYRKTQEWVNTPVHYVIKWEDGRRDSVYAFYKCDSSKNSPFEVRIGGWDNMKMIYPTCGYTIEEVK